VLVKGTLYQNSVHERRCCAVSCASGGVCDRGAVIKKVALDWCKWPSVISGSASLGHHACIVGNGLEIRVAVVRVVLQFWPEDWDLCVYMHFGVHLEPGGAGAHCVGVGVVLGCAAIVVGVL